MVKQKKLYLFLLIGALALTGCQDLSKIPLGSAAKSPSTTSTPSNTSANNTITATTSSTPIISQSPFVVNPVNPGTPIKSTKVIQDGNMIYYCNWSDGNKLYKIKADGTGKEKISDDSVSELFLENNTIFYSNNSDLYNLYSINTDSTNRKKVMDEKVSNLILIGNLIYFIDQDNYISTYDINSGKKISLNLRSRCFDSDGFEIYYENYDTDQLSLNSVTINGTNAASVSSDAPLSIVSEPSSNAEQSGTVYYVNGFDGDKIYKISSDGGGRTKLNDDKSSALQLDNGWIYYINNSDSDKIYKIKIDGSGSTKVSEESNINSFAVAGNFIYYDKNTESEHLIYKTNK